MPVTTGVSRARQRGLSLVELMVGIAIGLFVVAGATMLTSTQLSENRRLLLDTQVQQDLRATADIVTRELRRAGFWEQAQLAVSGPVTSAPNLLRNVSPNTGSGANAASYHYFTSNADTGPFKFELDSTLHRIRYTVGGGLQELTDPRTLKITEFSVTPLHVSNAPAIQIVCEHECPDGTADCWPKIAVREFAVVISGESVSDPSVQRTVRSHVRVRNDAINFDPLSPTQACPSPP